MKRTSLMKKRKSSFSLFDGKNKGTDGRMKTESALVIALSGKMIIDARRDNLAGRVFELDGLGFLYVWIIGDVKELQDRKPAVPDELEKAREIRIDHFCATSSCQLPMR